MCGDVRRLFCGVFASFALAVTAFGCGPTMENYQIASSGPTGCPPREIVISNEQVAGSMGSWTAQCQGRTFQCSAIRSSVTCNPAQASAGAAPQSANSP